MEARSWLVKMCCVFSWPMLWRNCRRRESSAAMTSLVSSRVAVTVRLIPSGSQWVTRFMKRIRPISLVISSSISSLSCARSNSECKCSAACSSPPQSGVSPSSNAGEVGGRSASADAVAGSTEGEAEATDAAALISALGAAGCEPPPLNGTLRTAARTS